MWENKLLLVLLVCWSQTPALSQWSCQSDAECSDLPDAVCRAGSCGCRAGTQLALGGTACIDVAPYHTSQCVEDHQCSHLFMMFECRRENQSDATGACGCQASHHYFQGRCWPTAGFGEACFSDAHCMPELRDPYALKCQGTCVCADGYYERQRGECRKIGYEIGDGCVINEDCQFQNGVCDISEFKCYDSTAPPTPAPVNLQAVTSRSSVNVTSDRSRAISVRSHSLDCEVSNPCPEPFVCSVFGGCVCPSGYYLSDDGQACNAELGSRSTEAQCVGLLAEVIDGICTCPPNFFFEENMRDCIKVSRRITDSCVSDENCFTFGAAARCGPPQEPWQLRSCECDTERSLWDAGRQMCRLFAGIGEQCEVDSDCLAGELEIQCVSGTCTCPAHLVEFEGLCLTSGLGLGEACQATPECTVSANTICYHGQCSCGEGYREDDGVCAAIIGGSCIEDNDCVIANTICVNQTTSSLLGSSLLGSSVLDSSHSEHAAGVKGLTQASLVNLIRDVSKTCQCRDGYVAQDDFCWTVSSGFASQCNVTSQCTAVMGENSACLLGACDCVTGYHHRDGGCWPITGLFEACSRTSQCYLQGLTERTVCRNSMCQCVFEHPYNEEMQTCGDGIPDYNNSAHIVSKTVFLLVLAYLTIYL